MDANETDLMKGHLWRVLVLQGSSWAPLRGDHATRPMKSPMWCALVLQVTS